MATWRAALRQGRGLWASRGNLGVGVAVDRRLSLNLGRRHYSPESESNKVLSSLRKPDVLLNTLIRPAPCEEDSRGAVYAAEFAVEALNAELRQGVCLTRVVRAHVLRMGWSIHSVSFEARDRKGDVRLYHAYVLQDLAGKTTRLFKCMEADESLSKPSFRIYSQTLKHSDPVDISQRDNDSFTWESKKIPIVPIDVYAVETKDHFKSLVQMIKSNEGYYIYFSSLLSASKADIYGGGVLRFLVMEAAYKNQKFRNFLAVTKSSELLVFRPVIELF